MLMRPARKSDFPLISKLFEPWFETHHSLKDKIWNFLCGCSDPSHVFSNVLELGGKIACASFWESCGPQEIEIRAFNFDGEYTEEVCARQLLESEIVHYSRQKISRISVKCPENIYKSMHGLLRSVGFVFESFSCHSQIRQNIITMTKELDHSVVRKEDLSSFLKEKFQRFGYEIKEEADGFSYRTADICQRPFLVSKWHRIVFSGNDLIVYPPAKRLESHEFETMFYPLRIVDPDEAPLLVTMEKKRALCMLSIPEGDHTQKSMFSPDSGSLVCPMTLNNITYSIVSGHKALRKGLPVLFYVNGVGAVGEARMVDWTVETVSDILQNLDNYPGIEIGDVDPKSSKIGPRLLQILKITFNYYKAFHRAIPLEEIRSLEASFNPQRRRFVSNELFESISLLAYQQS